MKAHEHTCKSFYTYCFSTHFLIFPLYKHFSIRPFLCTCYSHENGGRAVLILFCFCFIACEHMGVNLKFHVTNTFLFGNMGGG